MTTSSLCEGASDGERSPRELLSEMTRNLPLSTGMVAIFAFVWMGSLMPLCQTIIYTNDWAIRIDGAPASADSIAEKYGFHNLGQVNSQSCI